MLAFGGSIVPMTTRKERATKPAIGAWMERHRAARGWTQQDTVDALAERGYEYKKQSLYVVESGYRSPGPRLVHALEELFGEASPLHPPETPTLDEIATDLREILAAVRRLEEAAARSETEAPAWAVDLVAAVGFRANGAPAEPSPPAPLPRDRAK